jgi:hypothetical protein
MHRSQPLLRTMPVLSVKVMWCKEGIQTGTNILRKLIEIVCVLPNVNRDISQGYNYAGCNEAVLESLYISRV